MLMDAKYVIHKGSEIQEIIEFLRNKAYVIRQINNTRCSSEIADVLDDAADSISIAEVV